MSFVLRTLCLPLVLIALGCAALPIDVPVARWFLDGHCPQAIQKLCSLSEIFGHGIGIGMILVAVFVLDPAGRRFVPRIAAAAYGSGLFANLFKLSLARHRPKAFDFHGGIADSFGDWFPSALRDSGLQSFPSSHVAVAAGLAIALAWRYPRGRWLFAVMACLAAGQRLTAGAHFVSDVCWGAAVGCLFAPTCLPGGLFDRLFCWEPSLCRVACREPSESQIDPEPAGGICQKA